MPRAKGNPKTDNDEAQASILIEVGDAAPMALTALQAAAYVGACNLPVPIVVETRCCNRYPLHSLAYRRYPRAGTLLGSPTCCYVLRPVRGA
jgi:hypothetical protein